MGSISLRGRDPAEALGREWLLTNGLGGFAMGSLLGVNTRRYHGLLVAATAPPLGRIVALHSIIEQLVVDGREIELSSQHFGGEPILHPGGHQRLSRFVDHLPDQVAWTSRLGDVRLIKSLRLRRGRNEAEIVYELRGLASSALLRIRPLTPLRDFHAPSHEGPPPGVPGVDGRTLRVHGATAMLALEVNGAAGSWSIDPQWWRDFAYIEDRARGQGWHEDVWSPGLLQVELDHPGAARVVLRARVELPGGTPAVASSGTRRDDSIAGRLRAAADQFVVARTGRAGPSTSIIAGYPWFADWGRDAMISLPGLLLTTGRHAEALALLRTFAEQLSDGIVPNRFDDHTNEPHYNTVDASLWFVHATRAALAVAGATPADDLVEASRRIVECYRDGTAPMIRMDDDGLIAAGSPETQLTWMDAMRDGIVFTPRHGKAVEINALWHHALRALAEMTPDVAERESLTTLADRVARSFRTRFWWGERRCCHDVLVPGDGGWAPDGRLRPNQILAVSLPSSPLTPGQQRQVVDAVRATLLTPYGLRTLEPDHPDYRGRYEGDLMQRDGAYHQGTVWPWLIGPFCEAVLRLGRFRPSARADVQRLLEPLIAELDRGCLGQLAEVYDGDPPHRASGCPAQAWSVAEVLRLYEMGKGQRDRGTEGMRD